MSLIKDTLTIEEDLSKSTHRPAFKNQFQMLVSSGCASKKSVVFPINELEKATIDNVLNTVPLFYNPITKQLILQQDLEQQQFKQQQSLPLNKKCERPVEAKVRRLNNLNESFNNEQQTNCVRRNNRELVRKDCSKTANSGRQERKFLETKLDDFTTKSINLSQRTGEHPSHHTHQTTLINNSRIETSSSPITIDKLSDQLNCKLEPIKPTNNDDKLIHKSEQRNQTNQPASQQQQTKKDTFKTHRRTPSYIHDFHNVIKNNQNHQSKSHSSITVSSAAAAISNLTKTSLANASVTLSNTITIAKLSDHLMYSTTTSSPADSSKQPTTKQIMFNESKNELNFYDLDNDSETGSVFINRSKQYSIDDDTIEPLNLPLPYLVDKPKKLSLITTPLQSVLSRFTKSKSQSATNSQSNQSSNDSSRRNSSNDSSSTLITSTNGLLIFENQRPSNLPNKSPDEELNHRAMVEQMIRDAKRKEIHDAKQVKKNLLKKKKDEERMLNSIKVWQNEVIPNFEQVRNTKKVKELWSYGLPSNLRGVIWTLAIGNQLKLSDQSFENYLSKWYDSSLDEDKDSKIKNDDRIVNFLSKCSDESVYELIKLDVSRTFPQLKLFQKGAPFHDKLLKLLGTYVIGYRPEIGYIQGMSFILGMFLLNMDSKLAFNAFANLLNSSPLLMAFLTVDQRRMQAFYKTFDVYFQHNLPDLFNHFKQQKLNTELFMIDWVYTLFTKVLPLDISTRVWDLIFRDGEEVIIKTSLTLLKLFEKQLLQNDFINCAQFLTQLSTQSNNFPVDSCKFLATLNGFQLKPVTINKLKCKHFYSLYQHFNNSTNSKIS